MSDWGSLQGMTAEIEAAAAKALASPSGAPAASGAAGLQPADAHMQMRWALLLQDQVRQVQQHVQREQTDCSRLHAANQALRKELEQAHPNHPLLAAAPASAPPPPMPPPAALGAAAASATSSSACAASDVAAAAASAAAATAAAAAAAACSGLGAVAGQSAPSGTSEPVEQVFSTPNLRMLSKFLDDSPPGSGGAHGGGSGAPGGTSGGETHVSKVQRAAPSARNATLQTFDHLGARGSRQKS